MTRAEKSGRTPGAGGTVSGALGSVAVPSVDVLLDLAIRHVNAGQRDRARVLCERAAELHPPHPAVEQLRAVLSLQEGDAASAARHASASLALRPNHPQTLSVAVDAWFRSSLEHHDARDFAAAEEALRQALRLHPAHAEAQVNLGIVLQDAGRVDEAMQCYGRAWRLRPETFGRIAHALAAAPRGRLWLNLDALKEALGAAGENHSPV